MVVDGYVRVSQVAGRDKDPERFLSPRAQREQIERWARLNGATLARLFEELDESGARQDRPLFLEVTRRVGHETDGIVVAKLDRWARSLSHAIQAIEQIQSVGGFLISVQDGLDSRTESGKLVLQILSSFAEWELAKIRGNYETARRMAIARGAYTARAPAGYRKRRNGVLEVDPDLGPVITELFRRRAERAPLKDLVRFLEDQGAVTGNGYTVWDPATVRRMFFNRVYVGEAHSGEFIKPQAHPPLIDQNTFQRCQDTPALRAHAHGHRTLLSGLLRCAGCRYTLSAKPRRLEDQTLVREYFCYRRRSGGECRSRASIDGSLVEAHVERMLFESAPRRRPPAQTREERQLEAKLAAAEQTLATYRDSVQVLDSLGPVRFAQGLDRRCRQIERLRGRLAQCAARRQRPALPSVGELERMWPKLTLQQRREVIVQAIDCVFVARGHLPVEQRTHICWRGDAPLELPHSGFGHYEVVPFDLEAAAARRRPWRARERRWSVTRIERELRRFLGRDRAWPRFEAFVTAGRRSLHDQVMRQGGVKYWAERLGVDITPARREMPAWDEARVRAELSLFLRDKTEFPKRREFDRAGRSTLAQKVGVFGGKRRWAREFGLACNDRRGGMPRKWTPQRTRAALAAFLDGRAEWPGSREFEAAGLSGLHSSIYRYEGPGFWAAEFGLDYPPPSSVQRNLPTSGRGRAGSPR
jgi:DNA invertase Pin-like site-specific DNA recombinase